METLLNKIKEAGLDAAAVAGEEAIISGTMSDSTWQPPPKSVHKATSSAPNTAAK